MDDFKFNTLGEVYNKVFPALQTKVNDLKSKNIKHIKEEDVWDYLRKYYWNSKTDLTLYDLVSDILSTPDYKLEEYVLHKESYKNMENEIL